MVGGRERRSRVRGVKIVVRAPSPVLAPFVRAFWYFEGAFSHEMERVLPSGTGQLLVNLAEDELRAYRRTDEGWEVARTGAAAVSGPHTAPFAIDTAEQRAIAGVDLRAGGTSVLCASPASEVLNRHLSLEDLWGRAGRDLPDRLREERTPERILAALEAEVTRRAARALEPDPGMVWALDELERGAPVASVVKRLGMSDTRFVRRFETWVGLTPKRYARLRRFRRAVELARVGQPESWADVAAQCGYYDQAHLIRDFSQFSGETPTRYLPRSPADPSHVPI